ncbi:unnamed protein product [marine sediment metagenome]|uniref:Uncharacterized protein n=1 Tax=marine sediment metagenome TaxID=412755 RepID=X1V4P4_9ZZZZ
MGSIEAGREVHTGTVDSRESGGVGVSTRLKLIGLGLLVLVLLGAVAGVLAIQGKLVTVFVVIVALAWGAQIIWTEGKKVG